MNDLFISSITSFVGQVIKNPENKTEFIDPISCILKCLILNYKTVGTKISIRDNKIYIQDCSIFQGCQRLFNHDTREDLYLLHIPIFYFKGLESQFIHCNINNNYLKILKNEAIGGLQHLRATYEIHNQSGSVVKKCIDNCIKILKTNYTLEQYEKEQSDLDKSVSIIAMYNEFMKIWCDKDIKIILDIYEIFKNSSINNIKTNINEYLTAIDYLILAKDKEIDILRPN